MKITLLIIASLIISLGANGQEKEYRKIGEIPKNSKLGRLQGMWYSDYNSEEIEYSYDIVKGYYSLSFGRTIAKKELYGIYSVIGFQDEIEDSGFDYNLDSLGFNGAYYSFIIVEEINKEGIASGIDVYNLDFEYSNEDDYSYYTTGRNWHISYYKDSNLPLKLSQFSKEVLKDLIQLSKRDQRNYIKEFLDLDVREITTPKTYIYTAPNLKGKMYLLKGDIVTVLKEEKDFVKFEYETDKSRIITGYLKKEDLE